MKKNYRVSQICKNNAKYNRLLSPTAITERGPPILQLVEKKRARTRAASRTASRKGRRRNLGTANDPLRPETQGGIRSGNRKPSNSGPLGETEPENPSDHIDHHEPDQQIDMFDN